MGRRVDPERRAATVARLFALRKSGSLSTEHVRLAADGLGVDERSVRRWITSAQSAGPARTGPPGYELSDTDREAYAYYRANVAALHRARAAVVDGLGRAAGAPVPDFLVQGWAGAQPLRLRTMQVAFAQQLTPAERAAWREGEHARRDADVYLKRPTTGRNQWWELDNKQLPVLVLPPRGPAVMPWLITVIDDGTRAALGWAIMLTPHTGTVLTALRMALTYDAARGPYGAVPAGIRIDRGLDFAAEAVRDVMAALCVKTNRLPGFTPHRKGKIERFHQTIETTWACGLPGYTKGPRDAAGKLHGPLSDTASDRADAEHATAGPMRIELLAHRFSDWVTWYNTERAHAGLDGRTPLQAWNEDPTALDRIEAGKLRHLLMADIERTIGKDGIRHHNLAYVAPELRGRGGTKVQVRYMPHDDRSIEVYLDGAHLCTAYPQGYLSPEQTDEFRAHARAETKRLSTARRRAAARTREQLVPLTVEQTDATPSRLLPIAALSDAARRQAAAGGRIIRPASDLLGLHPPRTVPAPSPAAAQDEARAGEPEQPGPQPSPQASTEAGHDGEHPARPEGSGPN